jgi:ribosomal protein S10
MVTARMKVTRVTPMGDPEKPYQVEVEITPDYAGGANKEWSLATPSGMMRLVIDPEKTEALKQLPLGQSLEIQIVPRDN